MFALSMILSSSSKTQSQRLVRAGAFFCVYGGCAHMSGWPTFVTKRDPETWAAFGVSEVKKKSR
jgi:hypothetical protein